MGEDSTGWAGGQLLAVVGLPFWLLEGLLKIGTSRINFGSSAHRWIFKLSDTCYRWGEKKRGVGCCINHTREKMLYQTVCSVVNTRFCRNRGNFPSWS